MARQTNSALTVSGFQKPGGAPNRVLRDDDIRLQVAALAESVIGAFMRANIQLQPSAGAAPQWLQNGSPATLAATTLPEFTVPDLVYSHPGPLLLINFTRAALLPFTAATDPTTGLDVDPVDTVPPGAFWLYRAVLADGTIEQRIRLGISPPVDATTDIRAIWYVIDFTQAL